MFALQAWQYNSITVFEKQKKGSTRELSGTELSLFPVPVLFIWFSVFARLINVIKMALPYQNDYPIRNLL